LEMSDALQKASPKEPSKNDGSGSKRKRGKEGRGKDKDHRGSGKPVNKGKAKSDRTEACQHCGKWHGVPDNECWTLDKNQAKKPKVSFNKGKPKSEKSYMTQEEMCNMFKDLPMFKGPPVKKRKMRVEPESSSDEEPVINHSSDSSVSEYTHDYCYSVDPHLETTHADKKQKREHLTTEIIVEIKDRHGEVKPIRCLLDTGTSATIILRKFVAEGRA